MTSAKCVCGRTGGRVCFVQTVASGTFNVRRDGKLPSKPAGGRVLSAGLSFGRAGRIRFSVPVGAEPKPVAPVVVTNHRDRV